MYEGLNQDLRIKKIKMWTMYGTNRPTVMFDKRSQVHRTFFTDYY
jgi:hypothetical protein